MPDLHSEIVQKRVAKWRQDIVKARIKLASETLPPPTRNELWQIVDCREWSIKLAVWDFEAEMEQIDRELEAALRR